MSEVEQPTELQELYLQLSDSLLRPARLQLALRVSPEPPRYPFGCVELVNCSDAEGPSSELTKDAKPITLPGPQPARIERALQQCAALVQVTAQRSTLNTSRHQARQAALCQMILAERANLARMQSALQSTVIGYRVAVRKGALLQHTLNRLQPRFVGLRREKDRAERTATDLATQVQNLQQSLQAMQGQHDVLNGQVQTLQEEKTALTGRVEGLQGHQGRLNGRVLQLEEQNTILREDAASLQERLDATVSQQHQDDAAIQRFQMENGTLRYKAADQEQQIADQAQKLKAQEQHMHEQGKQMKGQEQQVVNLQHQVDGLHSKLKDEQKGKEAALKAHEEEVQDLQRQHQTKSAGQRSQINDLQQCLAEKTQQLDRLATDHSNAVEAQTAAVEDLASQLSDSNAVNSRQEAELSAKEAQVKRLDGELSEQQAQVHQLQTLASEKTSELERLTALIAEKQSVIENKEGYIGKVLNRLRSSQQELSAEQKEKASAVHAYSLVAQEDEAKIAALNTRLKKEQKGKAAAEVVMRANKAVVQDLRRQLAEQQTESGADSAAQLSKIDVLQQSLAAKSEQHDRLAEDYKNALQAHKAELQRATTQLAEKQSMVEVKQAEISKLGDCLTASQQEVAAVHQELASAAQAYSAVAQECESKIAELDLGLKKEQEDKADAVKASEAVAQELQRQLEEKQSEFEGKQAEIESLGSRLTASIEQVSTVHKELASAQQRHNIDTQEYEHRVSLLSEMLLQKDSAADDQQELIDDLTQRLSTTACEASGLHQQGASSRVVDDELDAEELHPELHHSEKWAGASSLQRHGSSSSELASSEQGQDTPKRALYQEQGNFGFDSEMGPSGFPASPQSNGWGPEPSSSAAASEQHDDGMRPPGFPATPNRSMGMAAAQSDRQQQPHEEQEEDPSTAAQHMQQHQDGHPKRRGKRGGEVARRGRQPAGRNGWKTNEGDPSEWKVHM